jgi:uncharacterized protein YdeI (YjbR/CyaY-like superfamily)
MKGKTKDLPLVQPKSRKAWRAWLQKNHASSSGIWLIYAKKHTGIPSLTYAEAVEEALCFGWIDSLVHPIDESLYKQVFTPRKETSLWSPLNRTRVEALIANGLMTPAGMTLIDLAKKTGRWDAWTHIEALIMPPELTKALDANPAAKKNWPTYTASQQKAFLRMVDGAKTAETRAKRVARVIDVVGRRVSFSDLVKGQTASRAPAKAPARRRR